MTVVLICALLTNHDAGYLLMYLLVILQSSFVIHLSKYLAHSFTGVFFLLQYFMCSYSAYKY